MSRTTKEGFDHDNLGEVFGGLQGHKIIFRGAKIAKKKTKMTGHKLENSVMIQ